jgi:hypothetical protein
MVIIASDVPGRPGTRVFAGTVGIALPIGGAAGEPTFPGSDISTTLYDIDPLVVKSAVFEKT